MTHSRLAAVGLATAMLLAATPALAGNGGAAQNTDWARAQKVEQLGPKFLLNPGSASTRPTTQTTGNISTWYRNLLVEEFGPKYLLGRELTLGR
jgi:hypothetical protein